MQQRDQRLKLQTQVVRGRTGRMKAEHDPIAANERANAKHGDPLFARLAQGTASSKLRRCEPQSQTNCMHTGWVLARASVTECIEDQTEALLVGGVRPEGKDRTQIGRLGLIGMLALLIVIIASRSSSLHPRFGLPEMCHIGESASLRLTHSSIGSFRHSAQPIRHCMHGVN
jgi:hypothetical protein